MQLLLSVLLLYLQLLLDHYKLHAYTWAQFQNNLDKLLQLFRRQNKIKLLGPQHMSAGKIA